MKYLKTILAAVSVLCLSACQSTTPQPNDHVLRVGVTANMEPLIFKQNQVIKGLEADFARLLAKELNKEVQFVELGWEDQIDALEQNKIDIIMSSLSITQMRQVRVNFTQPYMRSGQAVLLRLKDLNRYSLPETILVSSGTVAVEEGTTGDLLVRSHMKQAHRKIYGKIDQAVGDLIKEKIDMVIYDAPTICLLASRNEANALSVSPQLLSREPIAWAISRQNPELYLATNKVLSAWIADGTVDALIEKWLPFPHIYRLTPTNN